MSFKHLTKQERSIISKKGHAAKKKLGYAGRASTNEKEILRRKKISDTMKGNRHANHRGDRQSFYNGIRMDSKWETGVAAWFDKNSIKWKYGEYGFKLPDGRYYYPDFFIYDKENNLQKIIEVTGYFREENKKKFEQFKNEYPDVQIELWFKDELVELKIITRDGYKI